MVRCCAATRTGDSKLGGYLDDYAFLAAGLLDAFEATFETSCFDLARQLMRSLLQDFWDDDNGGFFFTGARHEALIDRVKSGTDQAIPSGTAVATRNLLRLYAHTGDADFLHRAERVLRLYRRHMEQQPFGYGSLVGVCIDYLNKPQEIVLIGDPEAPDTQAMLAAVQRCYVPHKTVMQIDPHRVEAGLAALPLLRDVLAGKTQVGRPCHGLRVPRLHLLAAGHPAGRAGGPAQAFLLSAAAALSSSRCRFPPSCRA